MKVDMKVNKITEHQSDFSDLTEEIKEKEVYLIYDFEADKHIPVKISPEQARTIDWFISTFDLEFECGKAVDCDCEEIK